MEGAGPRTIDCILESLREKLNIYLFHCSPVMYVQYVHMYVRSVMLFSMLFLGHKICWAQHGNLRQKALKPYKTRNLLLHLFIAHTR
jgi:hypothetical protein